MSTDFEFQVRQATPADVLELAEFLSPFIEQGRLLPRTHDELEELTRDGFVAIAHGKIVGFAALEIYSNKLAELRSLAVDPSLQGRGIGKAIVQACIERGKERRVFEIMTVTSADEFFRRCGFDFTLPGEKKALFLQTRDRY